MRYIQTLLTIVFAFVGQYAVAFDTPATAALVYDMKTDTVLLAKNSDRALPPASMSKLMTLNMVFEALNEGRVQLGTKFTVSKNAAAKGGSTMFLSPGEAVSVKDLIQGIIVQSGNDACITIAEGLAGTEDAFARRMTKRAKALGMNNSTFANATGWPHPNQRMSAADLVLIAKRLITVFPEHYAYFSQKEFTWPPQKYKGTNPVTQPNRNPLLGLGLGADGLKTGHTNEAGYGLVGSALQGDRRVIFMITGLDSSAERSREAGRLTRWAIQNFQHKALFDAGEPLSTATVWMGKKAEVGLTPLSNITIASPLEEEDQMELSIVYNGPLQAPIAKGDPVAELRVNFPSMPPKFFPLIAAEDVGKGGVVTRMNTAMISLKNQLLGDATAQVQ